MSKFVYILGDIPIHEFQTLYDKLYKKGYIPMNPYNPDPHPRDIFQFLNDCDVIVLVGNKKRDRYLAVWSGKPILSKINYE